MAKRTGTHRRRRAPRTHHRRARRTHRGARRTHGGNMLNNMAVPAGLLVLQRALMAKSPHHSRSKSRKGKGKRRSRR